MADHAEEPPFVPTYYFGRVFGAAAPPVTARSALAKALRERHLELHVRRADGVEEVVPPTTRRLDPTVVAMAWTLLESLPPGAELDSVVSRTDDGDLVLASLWWEEDHLTVQQAPFSGELLHDGPSEEALRARFPLGPLVTVDGAWDARSRGIVEDAYGALLPDERALLSWLPIERVRAPMGGETFVAVYRHDSAAIELYDAAVAPSPTFVGSVAAPRSSNVLVLVHELGHALMFTPRRAARLLYDEIAAGLELDRAGAAASPERTAELAARSAARSAAEKELATFAEANPVQDAYTAAVGDEPAPTEYGRTRPTEGFAEAFALWHLDRDALVRASPRAAAFFDRGDHVAAARAAVERAQQIAEGAL